MYVCKHVTESHQLDIFFVFEFTPFILLDKEKVQLYYVGLPFRQKWKYTIHIFMVDHRSTSLPECKPTKYPAPEPCFVYIEDMNKKT